MKKHLAFPDGAVLADYGNHLNKDEVSALAGFFSPWRIPVGLTDAEVRICIALYPLRKRQIEAHMGARSHLLPLHVFIYRIGNTPLLPEELRPDNIMTRRRFHKGIATFLKEIDFA